MVGIHLIPFVTAASRYQRKTDISHPRFPGIIGVRLDPGNENEAKVEENKKELLASRRMVT
jgi:hypothetical protein